MKNFLPSRLTSVAIAAAAFFPMMAAAQTTIPAQRVSDIATGGKKLSENANPANFTIVDTRLFFTASDKHGNRGVYEKDLLEKDFVTLYPTVWTGKGNTPKLLKNFKLPVGVHDMDQFVATEQNGLPKSGKVYFHVPGSGLWMTYGKTPLVLGKFDNLKTSNEMSDLTTVQANSGAILPLVYCSGWSKKTGQELYRSEGTAKTTKIVQDIAPGIASSNPDSIVELQQGDASTTFFRANSGTNLYPQIWQTTTGDLTNASIVLTSTLGAPTQLIADSGAGGLYFVMPTATSGGVPELWFTTGPGTETPFTSGGVAPLNVTEFPAAGDMVLFSGSDSVNGRQLWEASDFSETGQLLNIINPNGSANPYEFTAAGSEMYFGATVTDTNSQSYNFLFVTDGNEVDTAYVSNLTDNVTYYPVNPTQITPVLDDEGNGTIYFTADGVVDNEDGNGAVYTTDVLWMVLNDGESQATPVRDASDHVVTGASNLTAIVNHSYFFRLYFARDAGDGFGSEVWVTEN